MFGESTCCRRQLDQILGRGVGLLHEMHPVDRGHRDKHVKTFRKLLVNG